MFTMFVIGQFVLNPFVLWGLLELCARHQNEMRFLSAFFAATGAYGAALVASYYASRDLTGTGVTLVGAGIFFGVAFASVMAISKVDAWRGLAAVLLFCLFRLGCELTLVSIYMEPISMPHARY
jgi:hypothetical protein